MVHNFVVHKLVNHKNKKGCKTAFTSFTHLQTIDFQKKNVKLQAFTEVSQVSPKICAL